MAQQLSPGLTSRWNHQLKTEALTAELLVPGETTVSSIRATTGHCSPIDETECDISHSLIVADGCDPSIQELLKGTQHETYFLNRKEDAIQTITRLINARKKTSRRLDTLHIVAHGSNESIKLGLKPITAGELQKNVHLTSQWPVKNIALWSCEAASNKELIDTLYLLTGAHVYASQTHIDQDHPLIHASKIGRAKSSRTALSLHSITKEEALRQWQGSLALVSLPFDDGFVGDPVSGTKTENVTRLNTGNSFGWSNLQFIQESDETNANGDPVFKEQGNDITGSVTITDSNGIKHTIGGFVKLRQTDGGTVKTAIFKASEAKTLATSSDQDYTIDIGDHIGLTFNGFDPDINTSDNTAPANAAAISIEEFNTALELVPRLTISDKTITEDGGSVNVTVTVSGTSSTTITFKYSTSDNTATSPDDYTAKTDQPGSITAGQVSTTISIPIIDDTESEGSQSFKITIFDSTFASISDNEALITITDNDTTDENDPSVDDVTVSVDENIAAGTSITNLSDTSGDDTDADGSALTYAITAGNDSSLFAINSATGEITLASGKALDYETASSHSLTVTATEADGSGSDTATVTINVNNINDNAPFLGKDASSYQEVSITHDNVTTSPPPGATITARTLVDDGNGNISLSEASNSHIETVNNSFGSGFGVTGTIASGDTAEIGYHAASGLSEQLIIEFDEIVPEIGFAIAWLNSNVEGDGIYKMYRDSVLVKTGAVHATSDQVEPAITLTTDDGYGFDKIEFTAGGTDNDYLIHKITYAAPKPNNAATATINELADASNQDITAQTGDLTVSDADNGGTITAAIIGDPIVTLNGISYTLPAGASSLTASTAMSISPLSQEWGGSWAPITWTYDPDSANLDFIPGGQDLVLDYGIQLNDGTYDSNTVRVEVTITGENDAPVINDVTIDINEHTSSGNNLYDVNESTTNNDNDVESEQLSYAITGGNTSGIFTIDSSNGEISVAASKTLDHETASQHILTVEASDGTETDTATITINTQDITESISIHPTGTTDSSGNLLTSEAGGSATFTVVLDAQPTADVTVEILGLDPTENSLSGSTLSYSNTLTFTTANWNTPQTVTVTGVDDPEVDGDITTTLTASASNTGGYTGNESATVTVKNTDDDAATGAYLAKYDSDSFKVYGDEGEQLYIQFQAKNSKTKWQNTIDIHSTGLNDTASIGAAKGFKRIGFQEIVAKPGDIISFQQHSNLNDIDTDPRIRIKEKNDNFVLKLKESGGKGKKHDDLTLNITTSLESKNPLAADIATHQTSNADAILNFTTITASGLKVQLDIGGDSAWKHQLGFVKLDSPDPLTYYVNGISPTDSRYAETVIDALVSPIKELIEVGGKNKSQTFIWHLNQGDQGYYAPVLKLAGNRIIGPGSNVSHDRIQHVKILGQNTFGFEDRLEPQDPDYDYNDVVIKAIIDHIA